MNADLEVEGLQIGEVEYQVVNGRLRTYCTVDVPSDLYDGETNEEELRRDYAIYVAREELPDYRMPANWYVVWDRQEQVRVCRESRA